MSWSGYAEYDAMMCGEKTQIERAVLERRESYFRDYTERNEEVIRDIIRYAIEKYAGWTPEEAYEKMTLKMLGDLKLRRLIRYGLRIPYEANVIFREERSYKEGTRRRIDDGLDPQYIVSFAYPELFPYSRKAEIIKAFQLHISGEMPRLPKGFFVQNYHEVYATRYGYKSKEEAAEWTDSSNEIERAVVCLYWSWQREGLLSMQHFQPIREFMRSRKGSAHLLKYNLYHASKLFLNKMHYTKEALEMWPQIP